MGEAGWERARVLAGRPAPGKELTEDHTPLEAGLGHAVSLDKGCYIGQEVCRSTCSALCAASAEMQSLSPQCESESERKSQCLSVHLS